METQNTEYRTQNAKKAVVLFSGGLDSRLAAMMMKDQNFEVHLAFVKLPFGGGCCNNLPCVINFAQTQGCQLHIIDATKGDKFMEYVNLVKDPQYGRGTSMNPCKDCKVFIFKEGDKLAKELEADIIVTGEVSGQRPMSQKKNTMLFDDEMAGMEGRILRPLSAKLMPETVYEKEGLVDREKFLSIEGRRRDIQMKMADEYKIKYPGPGGGCLLCEKEYGKRLKTLYAYKGDTIPSYLETLFLKRGRMYKANGLLFVGRQNDENIFITAVAKDLKWNINTNEEVPGPTIVYDKKEDAALAESLRLAFISKDLKERAKYDQYKI